MAAAQAYSTEISVPEEPETKVHWNDVAITFGVGAAVQAFLSLWFVSTLYHSKLINEVILPFAELFLSRSHANGERRHTYISFACVAVVFSLSHASHILASLACAMYHSTFQLSNLREQKERLPEGWGRRMNLAHRNSNEFFPGFAAAVCLCVLGDADPVAVSRLCCMIVILRVLYHVCFALGLNKARITCWSTAYISVCVLYVLVASPYEGQYILQVMETVSTIRSF